MPSMNTVSLCTWKEMEARERLAKEETRERVKRRLMEKERRDQVKDCILRTGGGELYDLPVALENEYKEYIDGPDNIKNTLPNLKKIEFKNKLNQANAQYLKDINDDITKITENYSKFA